MSTESTGKEKLSVTDIVFGRFMEKILEAEELTLSEETLADDFKTITLEMLKDEGKYKDYIDDSLMYYGYRLREDNRNEEKAFQAHLQQDYGFVLYHLELIYLLSIELGEFVFNKISKEEPLNYLMNMQHVRACSIFSEIIHLIKGGYGTGAMARYRSLHELAVVSEFVFQNRTTAATAYLDYLGVMKAKDARYLKYLYGEDEELNTAISIFEQEIKPDLERKYGKKFADIESYNDYEWARSSLKISPNQTPNFGQLRKKVKREHGREQYKLSSNTIHSAPKSLVSTLGSIEGFPIAGASNIGLSEPGSWATYELIQMNSILLSLVQKDEDINVLYHLQTAFMLKLIQTLCNFVYEEFYNVEKEILKDDEFLKE